MEWQQRFEAKIQRTESCWIWTGGHATAGYGKFWLNGTTLFAHRIAYELWVGPIPAGLHIDHLCRNRGCVNPAHLETVTVRVNLLRGNTLAAANAAKTHCNNGHEFTDTNTYRVKDGSRMCRACMRARDRERYWRLRAAG